MELEKDVKASLKASTRTDVSQTLTQLLQQDFLSVGKISPSVYSAKIKFSGIALAKAFSEKLFVIGLTDRQDSDEPKKVNSKVVSGQIFRRR